MRTVASPAAAVLSGSAVALSMFIEMAFDPVLRVCCESIDIDWNGFTWTGVGSVGNIDPVTDSTGGSEAVRFALSGIPSENIALALSSTVRDRSVKIYVATMDPDTHAVLDATLIWAGVLDQMTISEEGKTSTVGVTAKHIGSLFSRVKSIRYTAGDQQKVAPGDTSLRFLTSQSQHQDIWPAGSFGRQ